ncbi:MAG: nucleotidyltransferase family protein, partial [Acidobacteriota bacterium]
MEADLTFGPEWAVLELLCIGLDEPDRRSRFDALITSGELHWGELLEQAIRHKMEVTLAHELGFSPLRDQVPSRIYRHLCGVYDVNFDRRRSWYAAVHGIVTAFEAKGIPVA